VLLFLKTEIEVAISQIFPRFEMQKYEIRFNLFNCLNRNEWCSDSYKPSRLKLNFIYVVYTFSKMKISSKKFCYVVFAFHLCSSKFKLLLKMLSRKAEGIDPMKP